MRVLLSLLLLAWASPSAWGQGAFLGVELDQATSAAAGARVASVQEPSAASLLGLQAGDLIVGLDEQRIDSNQALIAAVGARLPGELVTVHVMRGVETLALPGILGRRPGPGPNSSPPALPRALPDGLPLDIPWQNPIEVIPDFAQPSIPSPFWSGERPLWLGPAWSQSLKLWQMPEFDELIQGIELQPAPPGTTERQVHLRYPESTPQEERERLLDEARAKYGPDVQVEFAGTGTSISIQQSFRSESGAASQPAPQKPDEDDEI